MKIKKTLSTWQLIMLLMFVVGCSDQNLSDNQVSSSRDPLTLDRIGLSQELLDSTNHAEKLVKDKSAPSAPAAAALAVTQVNLARQASVSAESTYPGYSVTKINDGDRNTTVGPSYSWANNFPAGGKLPESVFLKFTSPKKINRIDIYTSTGYALQNYTIQYRTATSAPWITLVTVTGNTSVTNYNYLSETTVLEVQIICQLGPSNQTIYGRLNEVEIYGPAEPTLPSISTESGMLVFNSLADVDQTLAYLEYQYEVYSDAFADQYPGKTADEFADIDDAVGFNDDQPYLNFENRYGIYSLRAKIAANEEAWLASTSGDSVSQDPDEAYMDDYEVRSIVNSNGYVKVGTIYYVFQSDDSYYTYGGGPVPLAAIKSLKPGDPLPTGVQYHAKSSVTPLVAVGGCRSNVKSRDFQYNGDRSWRFKWKVKVTNGPFAGAGHVKAVTKSYRKKNGRWKVKPAIIGAQAFGNVVGQDCTGGTTVDSGYKQTNKRRKKVKAKVSVQNLAVLRGEMHGYHYHEKVGGFTSTLTW